jgi:hypothetical protein
MTPDVGLKWLAFEIKMIRSPRVRMKSKTEGSLPPKFVFLGR